MKPAGCVRLIVTALTAVGFFLSGGVSAQWTNDPSVNSPICTAWNNQRFAHSTSDGNGGAIFAWEDERGDSISGAYWGVYAQRVNASGIPQWSQDGVRIAGSSPGPAGDLNSISDGTGGAIILWTELGGGGYPLYAQRVDSSGTLLWTSSGIQVFEYSYAFRYYPQNMISDGAGGAFVTWAAPSLPWDSIVYILAQHINSTGQIQWGPSVVSASFLEGQENPVITGDDAGGAIIAWERWGTGLERNLYAQRLNSSGTRLWSAGGVPLCTVPNYQGYLSVAGDDSGGAIMAWVDTREAGIDPGNVGDTSDIYAQRLGPDGVPLWASDGTRVSTSMTGQAFHSSGDMVSDNNGGAIITWSELHSGTDYDVYAQRLDRSGVPQWAPDGVPVCTTTNPQTDATLIPDGSDGIIVAWSDGGSLFDYAGLFAQRLNGGGTPEWITNGVPVSIYGGKNNPVLTTDGSGGVLIAWGEFRGSPESDIYAQNISHSGRPGNTVSTTLSVTDRWNMVSVPVEVDDFTKTSVFPTAISPAFSFEDSYIARDTLANRTGYWIKFAGNEDVVINGYPRTLDTMDVQEGWNMIGSLSTPLSPAQITSDPPGIVTSQFFGYQGSYVSTDTIEPGKGYWVKSTTAGKLILAVPAVTGLNVDREIRIVASDGLPPAPPDDESASNAPVAPPGYMLGRNYPNPFNPTTMISYELPTSSHVLLKVFNVLGQEVRTLVDRLQSPGAYRIQLDGHDWPAGVYYYRLQAGSFVDLKKFVVLR